MRLFLFGLCMLFAHSPALCDSNGDVLYLCDRERDMGPPYYGVVTETLGILLGPKLATDEEADLRCGVFGGKLRTFDQKYVEKKGNFFTGTTRILKKRKAKGQLFFSDGSGDESSDTYMAQNPDVRSYPVELYDDQSARIQFNCQGQGTRERPNEWTNGDPIYPNCDARVPNIGRIKFRTQAHEKPKYVQTATDITNDILNPPEQGNGWGAAFNGAMMPPQQGNVGAPRVGTQMPPQPWNLLAPPPMGRPQQANIAPPLSFVGAPK